MSEKTFLAILGAISCFMTSAIFAGFAVYVPDRVHAGAFAGMAVFLFGSALICLAAFLRER